MDEPRSIEVNAEFYRTIWELIRDESIQGDSIAEVKRLMAQSAVEKLDCVALFQVQIAAVSQEGSSAEQILRMINSTGSEVIQFIAKHKLTDRSGFEALLAFFKERSDAVPGFITVLNHALKQISGRVNRRAALTVLGLSLYRDSNHIFFTVHKDVVRKYFGYMIGDYPFVYVELKNILFDTIIEGRDRDKVARLLQMTKLDLNEEVRGRGGRTFFDVMLSFDLPLAMTQFLVEHCGARVTSDSVAAAAGIAVLGLGNMSDSARYLQKKLREAELNTPVVPERERPAP